jgi:hypothetical protein
MSKYLPAIIAGVVAAAIMTLLTGFVFGGATPFLYGIGTGVFVAYIFANLAGNKKLPIASNQEKAAALELKPPPGKALLVVYRDGFVAKLAGLNVAVDGTDFAQLTAPKFTALAVPPGSHTLTCGFGGLAGPQSKPGVYSFEVAEGQVAGVGIGVAMGAVQGSLKFTPSPSTDALRSKVANMPMVKAEPAAI